HHDHDLRARHAGGTAKDGAAAAESEVRPAAAHGRAARGGALLGGVAPTRAGPPQGPIAEGTAPGGLTAPTARRVVWLLSALPPWAAAEDDVGAGQWHPGDH